MTLLISDNVNRLQSYLAPILKIEFLKITNCRKLSGGAIQENWLVEIDTFSEQQAAKQLFVLRTDSPSSVAVSHSRPQEYKLIQAAYSLGVTVPRPICLCEDISIIGQPFYMMECVGGSAIGSHIVRQRHYKGDMEDLAYQLGKEMAGIHKITPAEFSFDFLKPPSENPGLEEIKRFQGYLDDLNLDRPILELGLRYLSELAKPWHEPVLVHHDFRTGNYMVDENGLTAILDWEFAGWSDPHEDIGWLHAMCWRFGAREKPCGGVGTRESFYAGYGEISDLVIQKDRVRFWEIFAHIRWGVIALQQAERHLTGGEDNLNLAITGRMLPEMEYEILSMISDHPLEVDLINDVVTYPDQPDAKNLIDTSISTLREKLLPTLSGDEKFTLLMGLNALGIASREVMQIEAHTSAAELCEDIRGGKIDDQITRKSLISDLFHDVVLRLKISNPTYLEAVKGEKQAKNQNIA